jgi:hypothetical protein
VAQKEQFFAFTINPELQSLMSFASTLQGDHPDCRL